MSIENLRKVFAPPSLPQEAGRAEDWPRIEALLNTPLPEDYKTYINTYGSAIIGSFIEPFNPFARHPYRNLLEQIPRQLAAQRVMKEKWGERECPFPLYPEPQGLLPWGVTANGDTLYWQMVGDPVKWPVVLNESRGPAWEVFPESMTNSLTRVILGILDSEILGNVEPPEAG